MTTIQQKLQSMNSIQELMLYFEIDAETTFLQEHGMELLKRFNGYVVLTKPQDWFDYRRCLKNAYCRIHRSLRPKGGRVACRGCLSCERRGA